MNSQILSIPAFQSYIQKRNRHSSCRCTQLCDPNGSRGQHPVTHHSSQHEHGKSQSTIGTTQELPPFPWHTLAPDIFYWKRMDFLIVADVFSKYFLVRKLANSTSAAICAELATIVTELGLPHIIRSDNGPCYNSKEFQQFLQ